MLSLNGPGPNEIDYSLNYTPSTELVSRNQVVSVLKESSMALQKGISV